MDMSATSWIRVSYPAAAWAGWVAWMVGIPLFRAVIVAIAVALLVMVPWAVTLAITSTTAGNHAALPNDARGRQL
jgi:hypothetical protein